MKFGAVPDALLSAIDFTLPPDPLFNQDTLLGNRVKVPKVFLGASTWGDASWVGTLYPPKTPAKNFRQLYPQYFNAAELNATHYNVYSPEVIAQWAAAAKDRDFKYCPKFPQSISHYSNFENTADLTHAFMESIEAFGPHLGPAFLQTSESFPLTSRHALFKYLATLPQQHTYFLEVRHPGWYESADAVATWMQVLRQLDIGAVITDTPGRRDIVHMHLPIPKFFLRFVCNQTHPLSFQRIDAWTDRLASWIDQGLEEAYIFLHPNSDGAVLELATYWIERLNRRCGLSLQAPVPKQSSLF
ncbi:hypothetical protein BUE76_20430 [Cnuella takakiae]|nr:hypothetical protein BUE76_20430 [Cnuella takakiae]